MDFFWPYLYLCEALDLILRSTGASWDYAALPLPGRLGATARLENQFARDTSMHVGSEL